MLRTAVLAGAFVAFGVFVTLAYRRGWQWTGLPTAPGTSTGAEDRPAKTLWDWLQLLGIPVALAALAFLLNDAQSSREQLREDQRAVHQRMKAADAERENTLRSYLTQMSDLMLTRRLLRSKPGADVHKVARTATLTAVRRLDGPRRGLVVQFLAETQLLRREQHASARLRVASAHLEHAVLVGADLSAADLSEAVLNGAKLSRVDLNEADLSKAFLIAADLSLAVLRRADLSGADLRRAGLSVAVLSEANLSRANLSTTDLSVANLSGANLRLADVRGANLSAADLGAADLSTADLSGANLSTADLSGANLSEANLGAANLSEANLHRATLSRVDPSAGIRVGANLSGADLSRADLSGADLRGANLRGANLRGADLTEAKLSGARDVVMVGSRGKPTSRP